MRALDFPTEAVLLFSIASCSRMITSREAHSPFSFDDWRRTSLRLNGAKWEQTEEHSTHGGREATSNTSC